MLPVYRSSDGDRSSANRSVFEACERDLASGSLVAIFPEGTTGDRAGLDRVRSGAARIALGALPSAPDLVIMPIGLAFESKVETRSRTVVMFGEPIRVAEHANGTSVDDAVEPDRADVTSLTETIGAALEAVSPEFASVDEREMLRAAARIDRDDAARHGVAGFGDIEVVARRLAATDDTARAEVVDRYRRYATRLTLVGLDDRQVRRLYVSWPRLLLSAFAIVVAGPLLLTVTLIFVPALVAVVVGTSLVQSTATKGTVRFLLGLVTGLLTLVVAGIVLADGASSLVAAAAVAVGGVAALVVWPPIVRAGAAIHGRLTARDRGSLMRRGSCRPSGGDRGGQGAVGRARPDSFGFVKHEALLMAGHISARPDVTSSAQPGGDVEDTGDRPGVRRVSAVLEPAPKGPTGERHRCRSERSCVGRVEVVGHPIQQLVVVTQQRCRAGEDRRHVAFGQVVHQRQEFVADPVPAEAAVLVRVVMGDVQPFGHAQRHRLRPPQCQDRPCRPRRHRAEPAGP